jgi:hypothetical protein
MTSLTHRAHRRFIGTTAWVLVGGLSLYALACGSDVELDDGGGGGAGAACGGFENQPTLGQVTFTIENQSDRTIYLPASCGSLKANVDPVGTPNDAFGGACMTCEAMIESGFQECAVGGPCQDAVVPLEVGATTTIVWEGVRGSEDLLLPAECTGTASAQECRRVLAAEAGDYQLVIRAFDTCEQCGCTEGNDTCTGSASGLEAIPDDAVFAFPEEAEVSIVFGTCAFGCPPGGS